MTLKTIFLFLLGMICLLTSCKKNISSFPSHWQLIAGRGEESSHARPLLYRAWTPSHWIRKDPFSTESITDTMKSICEFYIYENDQSIRLTIHTFPITQGDRRIPPIAQITRWKRQFDELDLIATHTQPDAHGGFSGLFFEGEGLLQGNRLKIMGWSMQLASAYERQLNLGREPLDRYKRADYTIKASGPPDLMNKHRANIIAFAHSFELIDELPAP